MTALAWCRFACRLLALALCAWIVLTGWRPAIEFWQRHELRIEFRPRALIVEPMERWT